VAHACKPGLAVTRSARVRRPRRLPLRGRVLVGPGERVGARTVVARCELPGALQAVNLAARLAVDPAQVRGCLRVSVGERVRAGAIVAEGRSLFGLLRTAATAPCDGVVESVSPVTGQLLLREPTVPVEVGAYVSGVVCEVLPDEGVVVEAHVALVQGIFGVGGETSGPLAVVAGRPEDTLAPEQIGPRLRGHVVVGGAHAPWASIARAREAGVAALVVGGVDDADLSLLLGRDLGVAITGAEDVGLTLVLTEGFGRMPMAERTWSLLLEHHGREASVSGVTQIRAGVQRPEILIPLEEGAPPPVPPAAPEGLRIGARVRIVRSPNFGRLARVVALPAEPSRLETESLVRVVEVEFEGGRERALVARANVEAFDA
jgi:hypothetical protein